MDAVTLIFLSVSLLFQHFQSSDGCDMVCSESWRLNHGTNDGVIEVSFSNKTVPWNYTFLLWQWNTDHGYRWDASLLTFYQKEELLGNAVLRNSDKVVLASFEWKLHNSTLEWSYNGGEMNDSDWSIHLCRIGDWSFIQRINGKWSFHLGDMELYRPHGREKVILDALSEKIVVLRNLPKPEMTGTSNNQIFGANKYHRLRRSRFDKENFVHSNATPAEKWEIVQSILDRVFGNSEDLRRNGWVSHLNIFNILGRIFGLDQIFGSRSPIAPTTTESTDTTNTEPDAETVNTNFLRRFPGSRLKSKET